MTLEKKIRSELYKMSAMMVVLIGLGIYAHDFVIEGLKAKLALNSMIFILAGLAAWLAFRHVLALKNETVALKALQVDYGSIRRRPVNPYRHPAVVFDEPELLGQGYRMITEEFGKQGDVKISNSTVQMLLHDVDQRINDRKSTIMYFSGLMVFLGLLGAFMGLMKTVHSVSDLIGGMDLSGGAGVDGMSKMIEGMKAPLNGMSVGFSSSLFGLMTSMVLGALERCMTSAMKALRNEFEHWLSNLADLEGKASGTQGEVNVKVDADFSDVRTAIEAGSRQLDKLRHSFTDTADHAVQTRAAMGEMAQAVARLSDNVQSLKDPTPLLKPIADVVSDLARNQMVMLAQFKALYDTAEADRTQINVMLNSMGSMVERMNTLNGDQLHKQIDNLAVLLADNRQAVTPSAPAVMADKRPGFVARMLAAMNAQGVRREVRRLILGNRRLVRRWGTNIDDRLARMEAGRNEDRKLISHLVSHADDQQSRLEVLLDELDVQRDSALDTGLTGARMEMAVLRRRLRADMSDIPDETDQAAPDPTSQSKAQSGKA